jgi:two-component system, NtrC family, nitrogen regulation sensor histidine kinase NtrY
MSLRRRFVILAMMLVFAGLTPISWYAVRSISRGISGWHDEEVGRALLLGMQHVSDPETVEVLEDALLRYQQLAAYRRPAHRQMIVVGLGVAIVTCVLAVLVALLLATQLTHPLRSVSAAARRIAEDGDLVHTVPPSGIDEIAELVESFNDMVVSLRESRAALTRAERRAAWQDIARAIAHEIKNPLTPIRLTTQRLRERFTDNRTAFDDSFMRSTEMILTEIDRLERLANGFSDFAKMPAPNMQQIDLREVVIRVGELLEANASNKVLGLKLPSEPTMVMGDREQLEQAILNLVKNGLEAVAEDGGRVDVAISVATNRVSLIVTDNGTGIEPELLDTVFQPYVSAKVGGSGIGLAVVERVITDHRGKVVASNVESSGARFEITLPVSRNRRDVDLGVVVGQLPDAEISDTPPIAPQSDTQLTGEAGSERIT